ncbi:Heavy metal-associated isoprenylated plant protein 41 [Sesamum angolense]|uniref:Heavy metal-associated isoprenylated plant protein 41 n=1 Tax=Sesamum angolense TaxID=2727404 RepID=A0AAE2BVB3_9LAMI|nr:Heavy metal-associated isoprenylated plant protein 41 [Sesamum angolense]
MKGGGLSITAAATAYCWWAREISPSLLVWLWPSAGLPTSLLLLSILKKASSNINELRIRGCKVMHGIDATKMATHELLGHLTFDRIIYNFPFAGFFKNLSRQSQLRRHKRLVSLFLKNAKEMISEEGEIHISHKTNDFHIEWKLEAVAASHRLRLIEAVNFNHLDYPGYNTKCGFGGDNNFNCNPSKTYKFGLKYY